MSSVLTLTGILFVTMSMGLDEKLFSQPNSSDYCPVTDKPGIHRDCSDIHRRCNDHPSGIYVIQPVGYDSFNVFCDFDIDGGGWTVIQRRMDGSVSFQRLWNDYKYGFGFLSTEFWLGNEKLSYLTAQGNYELRIELENKFGNRYYAKYDHFRVGDGGSDYLLLLGAYSGNSGYDAMNHHRNRRFSTRDADHDDSDNGNCAVNHSGGWWFGACDDANLNALYGVNDNSGIEWSGLPGGPYELKFTEMKIRPKI